jgi:replication factor A1
MDDTGEIKATAFNAIAEEVDTKVVQGGLYYISRARVNLAKKKFSNIQNEYELSFDKTTEIVEVGIMT